MAASSRGLSRRTAGEGAEAQERIDYFITEGSPSRLFIFDDLTN